MGYVRGLRQATLSGTAWLLAQTVGARLISLGSQIVLAKILSPTDFGVLGLAGTVTAIVGLLATFGVDDVLLQRHRTMRFWTTPAFLTSLGLGTTSMLLVLATAPVAAWMYRTPALLSVLPILAIAMPLNALSTVPYVKIRASLRFRLLASYSVVELIIIQGLTILLALRGFGVYSFVIPAPIVSAVRAIALWIMVKPRLRRMRMRQFRLMGANGAAVFGTRILTSAEDQGGYFALGLVASQPAVGAYYFAFRLAIQPLQMLAGNLNNVLFPTLAQLQADPARQRLAALNASRMLAIVTMPYCFMQAAVARPLLELVFGAKWEAAIPLIQILSVGLAFDAVSWIAGSLFRARGDFRRAFILQCVVAPVFFLFVLVGTFVGSARGLAVAVSLFYIVFSPVYAYYVFSRIGADFRDLIRIYLGSTVLAATAMTAAYGVSLLVPWGHLAQVATIVLLGNGLYLSLIRILARDSYTELFRLGLAIIRTRREPPGPLETSRDEL